MKACRDVEVLWQKYSTDAPVKFDKSFAEEIKKPLKIDADRVYLKYCKQVHKKDSGSRFSPDPSQIKIDKGSGFEPEVRNGLRRIPRRCNGCGLTGVSTHFPLPTSSFCLRCTGRLP
eukprot:GHVU01031571.1.p2 GENE.GHVU01031571.1~~GHVU01031571.1.p2  ORF type:complete len:117 (+),score=11.65 GHVU01031571.1:266-616(+)